jgi:hypothetical protein
MQRCSATDVDSNPGKAEAQASQYAGTRDVPLLRASHLRI